MHLSCTVWPLSSIKNSSTIKSNLAGKLLSSASSKAFDAAADWSKSPASKNRSRLKKGSGSLLDFSAVLGATLLLFSAFAALVKAAGFSDGWAVGGEGCDVKRS